jgi:hypothetical protein
MSAGYLNERPQPAFLLVEADTRKKPCFVRRRNLRLTAMPIIWLDLCAVCDTVG